MSWQPDLPDGISGFRNTGEGFEAQVSIPADEEGFFGRECPDCRRFFKMRVDQCSALPDDAQITCPYCGYQPSDADDFMTPQQRQRVESAAATLAEQYVHRMFQDAFRGLQTRGLRPGQSGVEIRVSSDPPPRARSLTSYTEEQVRRTITCESCQTEYAVYGATAFCPLCGPRAAAETVLEAIARGRQSLAFEDVLPDDLREEARASGLFDRAAADAVKEVVTLFEVFTRDRFESQVADHEAALRPVGRGVFQRLDDVDALFAEHCTASMSDQVDPEIWSRLQVVFQQRHVLVHRQGIIDEQYVERVPEARQRVGQRLVLGRHDAEQALDALEAVVRAVADASDRRRLTRFVARLRFLSLPIALVPIVAGFLYVAVYGIDVPVQDDWGTVITLSREAAGTLSISDLFSQHNEQRIFFPRVVEIALAKAGGYSPLAEMYVTEGSFLAALAALALVMRRTLWKDALLLLPVVAYLVFSFRQSETMLLGFDVSNAFVEAFGVLALALLWISRRSLGRVQIAAFVGALAAATVATYSSSQGLVVWPAGIVALWLTVGNQRRKRALALWGLFGIGEWILYFKGYESIAGHPSSTYAFHHPLLGLKYLVSLFGASLIAEPTRALAYGVIFIALAVGALVLTARAHESRRMSFWLALLAYSALMMLSITIGRSGYGVNQALTSRYSSFSTLGVIAVLGLLARRARAGRSKAALGLLGATVVLIALSVPGVISDGLRSGRYTSSSRKRAAYILYMYRSEPDALLRDIFPNPALVREFAPFLEDRRYVVFAAARPPVPPAAPPSPAHLQADGSPSSCTLDSINGAPAGGRPIVSLERSYVVFGGWCLAPGNNRLAGGVYITLDGHYFPAYYGEPRPDVADFFHNRGLAHAGFEAAVRLTTGAKGAHTVGVVALSTNRKRYYQPNPTVGFELR